MPIRPFYEPGLPVPEGHFRHFVQKRVHFYTLFLDKPVKQDSGKSGNFALSYKTLIYAIGRPISLRIDHR
jgi:hypothetical protein